MVFQTSRISGFLTYETVPTIFALEMQELGYPWVMRKMLIKYGSKSTDIVKQKGSTMTVISVNAKGSWARVLDTDKLIHQVCSKAMYHVQRLHTLQQLIAISLLLNALLMLISSQKLQQQLWFAHTVGC